KPVLVICYNITLARKLKALIEKHTLRLPVEVTHFHLWCHQQLQSYGRVPPKSKNFVELMENALSIAFEDGIIQPEQYSAVLIDEGHDFN
ncbi:restriction endonuclease, partial [Salmonella enterica subsp. enterica serovar Enteritidis]